MLVLKWNEWGDYIAWVIFYQQKPFLYVCEQFRFVQSTNISTLAKYQWWQILKFILITIKVIVFIRREKKSNNEASMVKSSLFLRRNTNLYQKLTRISNALLRPMTTNNMSPKCPLHCSRIALNYRQSCVVTALPSVRLATCPLLSYIIWLFRIPSSLAAWHWKSATLPGSWQHL